MSQFFRAIKKTLCLTVKKGVPRLRLFPAFLMDCSRKRIFLTELKANLLTRLLRALINLMSEFSKKIRNRGFLFGLLHACL